MALKNIIVNAVNKEIDNYAKDIEKIMKSEVHVKSGALQDSISTEKKSDGHYLVGVDAAKLISDGRNISKTDYSKPYYYGHRAFRIVPKRAKALRWTDEAGFVHFSRSVKIPASAGDPFINRTMLKRPKLK